VSLTALAPPVLSSFPGKAATHGYDSYRHCSAETCLSAIPNKPDNLQPPASLSMAACVWLGLARQNPFSYRGRIRHIPAAALVARSLEIVNARGAER
jgi:hypothetical protein